MDRFSKAINLVVIHQTHPAWWRARQHLQARRNPGEFMRLHQIGLSASVDGSSQIALLPHREQEDNRRPRVTTNYPNNPTVKIALSGKSKK